MKKLLVLLMCIASLQAKAFDDWSNEQIIKQVAIGALFIVDAKQTLDIKNHEGIYETNPILGKHPSDDKIIGYFIGAYALHTLAVHALPSEYRSYLQNGTIALELVVIANNKRLGLNIKW